VVRLTQVTDGAASDPIRVSATEMDGAHIAVATRRGGTTACFYFTMRFTLLKLIA
jgi:hypothetical protein